MIRKNCLSNCKKANWILDLAFISIFLLVVAVIAVFASYTLNEIKGGMVQDDLINAEGQSTITDLNSRSTLVFDGMIATSFILLSIFLIISAFSVNTNPIFFWITSILMVLLIGVNAILSNVWEEIGAGEVGLTTNYTMTNIIFGSYPTYVLLLAIMIAIFTYGRQV